MTYAKTRRVLAVLAASLLICAMPARAGQNSDRTTSQSLIAAALKAELQESGALQSALLAQTVNAYRGHPDPVSWQGVWAVLHELLASPAAIHAPAAAIIKSNPGLTDLGIKVVDAEFGSRVWAFPKLGDCQAVLVQYQIPAGPGTRKVVGRGRHRKIVIEPPPMVSRLQALPLPATVGFRDAQFVRSTPRLTKAEGKDLVLVGNERSGGTMWIAAYKVTEGGLVEDTAALSSIPSYLIQNVAGTPGFSGNNLVLALSGGSQSGPQSSGYKIVLKFVDFRFCMEGQSAEQDPSMAVFQFVQALQQNRIDVARAWLADPKLISIPKYIGMFGRASVRPCKVIAMSSPLLSGARFRIMTFDKDDLIADVGKVKTQWVIKALFIAPPDPLALKLVGAIGAGVVPPAPESGGAKSSPAK